MAQLLTRKYIKSIENYDLVTNELEKNYSGSIQDELYSKRSFFLQSRKIFISNSIILIVGYILWQNFMLHWLLGKFIDKMWNRIFISYWSFCTRLLKLEELSEEDHITHLSNGTLNHKFNRFDSLCKLFCWLHKRCCFDIEKMLFIWNNRYLKHYSRMLLGIKKH